MKMFIICASLAGGLIGGIATVAGVNESQSKAQVVKEVPVDYIDFQEPLYIRGNAKK